MKRVRYTKFTGDLADEIDLEGLLQALSDYLLDSGFADPYAQLQDLDQSLDDLREALRRILEQGDFLDGEMRQKLRQAAQELQASIIQWSDRAGCNNPFIPEPICRRIWPQSLANHDLHA